MYLCEGQFAGQSHPLLCQQLLLILTENQLLNGLLGRLLGLVVRYRRNTNVKKHHHCCLIRTLLSSGTKAAPPLLPPQSYAGEDYRAMFITHFTATQRYEDNEMTTRES